MKLRTRKQIRENEEKIYLLRNRKIHVDKKKMSGKNVPVAALKIRSQNELLSSKGKERLHKKTPLKETNEKVKPPKFSKKLNLSQNKNFERKSKKLRERSFERDILGTSIAIPLCDVIDSFL
ncbi:hypothetical protein MHBO_002277 [Bonamia ostreae]|uniref:Uncharacterized protein n=1 Tax=Bonamia ostreae TaxID=126728 RepID=A0ABV2ALS5_9EUKA